MKSYLPLLVASLLEVLVPTLARKPASSVESPQIAALKKENAELKSANAKLVKKMEEMKRDFSKREIADLKVSGGEVLKHLTEVKVGVDDMIRRVSADVKMEAAKPITGTKKLGADVKVEAAKPITGTKKFLVHSSEAERPGDVVSRPPTSVKRISNSAPETGSKPRWKAMVINLDRRRDRLRQFTQQVLDDEPWIFGSLCRIRGRDGRDFKHASSQKRFKHMSNQKALPEEASRRLRGNGNHRTRSSFGLKKHDHDDMLSAIPRSLQNTSSLVSDGWITNDALNFAEQDGVTWPKMTPGGIGLYLAHADAWEHVVGMNLDFALIFEDDLTLFSPSFESEVSKILESRSRDSSSATWDMLYLQRCDDKSWLKERSYDDEAPVVPTEKPVEIPIPAGHVVPCTGAYILTRRGAQKLLQRAFPANSQLDDQISSISDLKRVALSPPVAQCQEVLRSEHGVRYRDTDVQREALDLHRQKTAMDALADEWLAAWKARHKSIGVVFAEHGEGIQDCSF